MTRTIGIVGGGLMGCLAALNFARRGDSVVLFERRDRLMAGASAGNEGKIHLGFTYGLDKSGQTQRLMHAYGSKFLPALERLFGRNLGELILHHRQYYAVHRDSALKGADVDSHMASITALHRTHKAEDNGMVRPIGSEERESLFSDHVIAAWEVAEPTLDCPALVRLVTDAVAGEPRIELRTGTRVGAITGDVRPNVKDRSGQTLGTFDLVINAAWDGLPALEQESGVSTPGLCLRAKAGFVANTLRGLPDKPVTFVYGSFGDMVPLHGNQAYLSWYPSCLMGFTPEAGEDVDWYDRVVAEFDFEAAYTQSCAAFRQLIPGLEFAERPVEQRSGPILAFARSDISDPESELHTRSRFGITRRDGVFAVNTGKLTCASGLAEELDALVR